MIKLPLQVDGEWLDPETPWLQDLIENSPQFGPLAYMYDKVALGRITAYALVPETPEIYALINAPYINPMLLDIQPLRQCELRATSIDRLETTTTLRVQAIHFIKYGYHTYLGSADVCYTDAYSISSCALDLKDMVRLESVKGRHVLTLHTYSEIKEDAFKRHLLEEL